MGARCSYSLGPTVGEGTSVDFDFTREGGSMDFDINFLAVLLAAVAHQVLGFLWYGVLFKKTWLQAMGKSEADAEMNQGPDATMAIGALWSLVSALGIALLLTLTDEPTVGDGIAVGAVCGIAFATASLFFIGMYEQRKSILSAMSSGYQTVGFVIMGAIIGAMG